MMRFIIIFTVQIYKAWTILRESHEIYYDINSNCNDTQAQVLPE